MAAQDIVNRVFREFKRYSTDGLPNPPTNAPLPVGDPQSGVHNPKKSELREAFLAVISGPTDEADRAKAEADRAEAEADRAELWGGRSEDAASDSQDWASQSETARDEAILAAQASGAPIFPTVGDGEAGTGNGDIFMVIGAEELSVYENDGGTGVLLGTIGTGSNFGQAYSVTVADLNAVPEGFAYVSANTETLNTPYNTRNWIVLNVRHNSTRGMQIAGRYSGDASLGTEIYARAQVGGDEWTDWTSLGGGTSLYGIVSSPVEELLKEWQKDNSAVRPKGRRTALYDDLVESLIDAGVWDKLDFLYLFGAHAERNALYDLKVPSRAVATVGGQMEGQSVTALTYEDHDNSTSDLSVYTFSLDLGIADVNGKTVICIAADANAAGRTVSSVVIDPSGDNISATRLAGDVQGTGDSRSDMAEIWVANTPDGGTADVQVNFSGAMQRCGVSIFRLLGIDGDAVAYDVATNTAFHPASLSVSLDIPANGAAVAAFRDAQTPGSWSGLTERNTSAEFESVELSVASDLFASEQSDRTISYTNNTAAGRAVLAAVSFGAPSSFAPGLGFQGNGADRYIDLGFARGDLSGFSRNEGHIGAFCLQDFDETAPVISAGSGLFLCPSEGGSVVGRINQESDSTGSAVDSAAGYTVMVRDGSNSVRFYKNGMEAGTDSQSSADLTSDDFLVLADSSLGEFSRNQVLAIHGGSALTLTEVQALYLALSAYAEEVGAV